jgi:hypothetical protein
VVPSAGVASGVVASGVVASGVLGAGAGAGASLQPSVNKPRLASTNRVAIFLTVIPPKNTIVVSFRRDLAPATPTYTPAGMVLFPDCEIPASGLLAGQRRPKMQHAKLDFSIPGINASIRTS